MSFFDPDDFVSDDDNEEYSFNSNPEDEEKDLEFMTCCMIKNCFSLSNKNGYFLIEISDDGLLLEPSIRSYIYDLNRSRSLKIIGVDMVW